MIVKYTEIFKLKVMLDEENIPYEFLDRSHINYEKHELEKPFYQIVVYYPNQEEFEEPLRLISVIQGWGSYGESQDLLEIQGLLTGKERKYDSVAGHLTAKEVFKRIKKYYNKLKEENNE